MRTERLGCTPPVVPPHTHRLSFRLHPEAAKKAPPTCDLRETGLVALVKDQGRSGSCEGHSGSGATESAFALKGDPLGFIPSEQALYTGGRAVDRGRSTPAAKALPTLKDEGAMTEDVLAFMSTFGVRARRVMQTSDGRNSDVEIATVNAEPKADELEESIAHVVVGPYAIDPSAEDAEDLVQAAIAAKIPVRVDAFVDAAFEGWTPDQPPVPAPDTTDPNGGGHAIYIVGYGRSADGTVYYIVRNSWGEEWGDGGDVHVSSAWIRKAWGLYPWNVRRVA